MFTSKLSRRNFMQQSAAFGPPPLLPARSLARDRALAAREKELNILCWEGYNSAQVLDPFRAGEGRHGQGGVPHQRSDHDQPAARRRDKVWDLINVNNPWARKVMLPERLIKPLDRANVRALLRQDAAGLQAAL